MDETEADEEANWETICNIVAKRTGITVDRARAILEASGMHAFGHTGIVDAMEEVADALNLPADRRTWRLSWRPPKIPQ